VTGNTVVDALLVARKRVRQTPVSIDGLNSSLLDGKRLILLTAHRRESFGNGLEAMCRAFLRIADEVPDVHFVYPVHLNPNVRTVVRRLLTGHSRVTMLEPVDYLQFVWLMERAYLILTDSGGVQEEAPTFGKPILVLREVTERPEGVEANVARLVGTDEDRIVSETLRLLNDCSSYDAMARGLNPYGDGFAAKRIVDVLENS
jgi:UDP-N-acetylglucosamine 2-epimerase (non-hydrolysing)